MKKIYEQLDKIIELLEKNSSNENIAFENLSESQLLDATHIYLIKYGKAHGIFKIKNYNKLIGYIESVKYKNDASTR